MYALVQIALSLLLTATAHASEQGGRLSLVGVVDEHGASANQQGLRWMVDDGVEASEWSLHLRATRQQHSGGATASNHSSRLFRAHSLQTVHGSGSQQLQAEVDRLLFRHYFEGVTVSLGRQPIEWGAGHFWQPTNLLGAFSPTDLDTAYKPGIDAALLEWSPQELSAVSVVHTASPATQQNSTAAHYRSVLGVESEFTLVVGQVIGHKMVGGSLESSWGTLGVRLEGRATQRQSGEQSRLWVVGAQYQFEEGTLLDLEWYENSRGAEQEHQLLAASSDLLVLSGLLPQSSRNLLGVSLSRDLTPLLRGGYMLLASRLEGVGGESHSSLLNQLNLNYSLSDESELLLSVLVANGKEAAAAVPQSEFGDLPDTLTLRYQYYF
ncbi:MAG: hypothetical protein HOE82_01885 [Gammaproteobacteria bacterium]|jgi:hypothetical protein|nr:hypothetical protein [Gammaproteobacteria bacterium]